MAIYSFNIRRQIRDDMYKSETIELELSETEARNLNNDNSKYSKTSAFLSAKLGEQVQANGLPRKKSAEKSKKETKDEKPKRKSFWRPLWAVPFKLIWWLIKLPFKLLFSK